MLDDIAKFEGLKETLNISRLTHDSRNSHKNRKAWNIPYLFCNIIHLSVFQSKYNNGTPYMWNSWQWIYRHQNSHGLTGSLELSAQWDISHIATVKLNMQSPHTYPILCVPSPFITSTFEKGKNRHTGKRNTFWPVKIITVFKGVWL